MRFPYRKWALRGLRISMVLGVSFAAYDAFNRYLQYADFSAKELENRQGYECAARLEDGALLARRNEFGTINVRPLGCATRDFFVSMHEVKEVRAGTMTFSPSLQAFYPEATLMAGLFGFGLGVFLVGVTLAIIAILRWVWGRREIS